MDFVKTRSFLVLTLALAFATVIPLFRSGMPQEHDNWVLVQKSQQLSGALADGQFPPRLAPDFQFQSSYPILDFMYPLPMYVASVFRLAGFEYSLGVKFLMTFSMLAGAWGMYMFSSKFWGRAGGFLSAIAFTFAPYHAIDLYVRGSVGELLALAIAPFLLFAIAEAIESGSKKRLLLVSILSTLLILSHNVTALIFFPALLTFTLFYSLLKKSIRRGLVCFVFLAIGVAASAYFWLPAIYDKQYIIADEVFKTSFNYKDHFVYPVQLFLYSPWGFGGSQPGPIDGFSFKLQKQFLALYTFSVAMTIFLLISGKNKLLPQMSLFFVVWGMIAAFLTLTVSQPVWDNTPFLYLVQFPWRFLTLLILAFSFPVGVISQIKIRQNIRDLLIVVLAIVISIMSIIFFKPDSRKFLRDSDQLQRFQLISTSTTLADEFRPKDVRVPLKSLPDSIVESRSGDLQFGQISFKSNKVNFFVSSKAGGVVRINKYYFPGWRAFSDGREVPIKPKEGYIEVAIPSGSHNVQAKFSETPVRKVADGISFFGIVIILTLAVVKKREYGQL